MGSTLGRYRLERELGAGGTGVVYAAFDPDLERRVALKVLRTLSPALEAKDRLMREARAMARLSHLNVVTVHEVGTANGRDFVAMELIHGESLAEWLRQTRRPRAAIIDAFIAAGRGLAAAHAAGIVHRDFKPHNVLRSRDGRIAVTDFGLAREAECGLTVALDATLPVGSAGAESSPLAGLTVTGALLGTPAYMAPEQWRGGAVGPPTDQFSYCVALWEALSGERPYRGPTLDDLRTQVARGPVALDASRIPRRIRGILRRGLDPDPGKRWPSLQALLDQLVRAQRRPRVALGVAAVAAVAAVVMLAARTTGAPVVAACPPPARDVAAVWSPAIAADLRAKTSDAHVAVLETASWDWRAVRDQACKALPQVLPAQLQCLDGVLARLDAIRQGYARVSGATAEDLAAQLIDPAICRKPTVAEVPRLAVTASPEMVAASELFARTQTDHKPRDEEAAAMARASTDPCARVVAALALDEISQDVRVLRPLMNDMVGAADQCGDERLRADLLIELVAYRREWPMIGPRGMAAIQQARVSVRRVTQPDLEARLALRALNAARQSEQWDEAFRLAETAIAGYHARGLTAREGSAVLRRAGLRLNRGEPQDFAAIVDDVARWQPIAAAIHRASLQQVLALFDAWMKFQRGDVASAHAALLALWQLAAAKHIGPTRKIEGTVVDARGAPVAGARVVSASHVAADAVGIGAPLRDPDGTLRITTSDGAGRFQIDDAAPVGVVVAEVAGRRSRPQRIADRVRLALEPTRRVTGRLDLAGISAGRMRMFSTDDQPIIDGFAVVAPVAADGAFTLDGVGTGAVRIGVAMGSGWSSEELDLGALPASTLPAFDLRFAVPVSDRTLDVVTRSAVDAPLDGVQVSVLSGKQPADRIRSVGDIDRLHAASAKYRYAAPVLGEPASRLLSGKLKSGDLVAHFEHVRAGDLTVCAFTVGADPTDNATWDRLREHSEQVAVKCEAVAPGQNLVVLAVPPQQRLE